MGWVLIRHLQEQLDQLSKAERSVADVVLANPEWVVSATTAELASRAGVSDPTISRFSKRLGSQSFPDFKVQLARSLESSASYISGTLSADDGTMDFANKLIDSNQRALEFLREQVDSATLERSIDALAAAKTINVFGMGACASVAQDAQMRLFRLGPHTAAYEDHLKINMAAAASDAGTLTLIVSFTGRTAAMVDAARIAQEAGSTVLSLVDPASPLAAQSDIVINSGYELEDTNRIMPMATRIVILTILDILIAGLALRQAEAIEPRLQKIKASLAATKMEA